MKKLTCLALALTLSLAHADSIPDLPVHAGWAFANAKEEKSTDADKIVLIQKLGYAGFMGCQIADPPAVKAAGVTLPGLYFSATPTKESLEDVMARLEKQLPLLSKEEGSIWLFFLKANAETPKDEAKAVEWLRHFDKWAAETGWKVSLYAHSGDQFYWPNSAVILDYLKKAEAKNLGLVFTTYHEIHQGFEPELISRLNAAFTRISHFAVAGPDLIERQQAGDDLYVRLFQRLATLGYSREFLIYSRPYTEHASVYLARQKEAFEVFRKQAAAE